MASAPQVGPCPEIIEPNDPGLVTESANLGSPHPASPSWQALLLCSLAAAAAFHLAWAVPALNVLAILYAGALIQISAARTPRLSFRFGFIAGFLIFAPQLAWFWTIFSWVAICLWALLSFFTGAFCCFLYAWQKRFGPQHLWLIAPIAWTGIEFFRGELYPLKFTWLSVGYLFSGNAGLLPVGSLGVYGTGFGLFLVAAVLLRRSPIIQVAALAVLLILANFQLPTAGSPPIKSVKVAGIQLEFPPDLEVPAHLDRVLAKHPDAQILVLSEYAFDGPIPKKVREWCRTNSKYLIAGGKEEVPDQKTFHNTAFVIDPNGEVIFQQGKSVPIQFFNDGLPAPDQRVWQSPWGAIAIPTCYDLSYRRITDRFVAAGAQAFIVPFMDVADWGEQQHRQHTRIAPMRAREYRLSIFRLGSSGISQHIDRHGNVLAQANFPGQEQIIAGELEFAQARLPLDRILAPACSLATALLIVSVAARAATIRQRAS